ncbi:MAG: cytochrome C [Flavobacteriaceae bacterium]|nr:cytochrome C [Flavobacteriaceae bacterium]|tara:strand:- start:3840 stop:4241 length:402 start_codon:yes stop_codon:yes gene_type:complete
MKVMIGLIGLMVLIEGTWLFQNKPLVQSISDGKEIYQDFCIQCHLDTGKGVSGVFPPLAQSDYLLNDIDLSIKGIKYGMSGPITVNGEEYNGVMQNQGLDEVEITDVMNYVINSWGNKSEEVITPERVASITK